MRVESELVGVRDLRRRVWLGRFAMLALWIAAGAIFFGGGRVDETTICWTPLGLLAGTSILLGVRHGPFAGSVRGLAAGGVTVEGGAIEVLVLGRRRRFRVDEVTGGWTEPVTGRAFETAVLQLRRGIEVRFASARPEAVARLLRAAGVAADQRAARIRVRPGLSAAGRALAIFVTFIAALMMLWCSWIAMVVLVEVVRGDGLFALLLFGFLAAFAFASGLVIRRFGPALFSTTLSVGTDGVVLEGLVRTRLLRRAEIVDVMAGRDALAFHLEGGEVVRVPASMAAAVTVANRIEEALRLGPAQIASSSRLDRGGRPLAAWIAELRGLSRGTLGYRRAALARHELLDLVKDGAAPAERRIGAALALSADEDPEARAALRIAADTCVDERLRVVLGRAGDLGEEELEEAIAQATAAR